MIRRLRHSPTTRAGLGVAMLLSLVAAFGLHPEPSDPCARVGPRFAQAALHTAAMHDCVACLHAGSAIVASKAVLGRSTDSAAASVWNRYVPPSPEAPLGLTGRSPPAPTAS